MNVVLSNRHLTVVLDPESGASMSHLGVSGDANVNLLAAYHWAAPLPATDGMSYGDSRLDWLSGYRGGWQLLTPNAGAECEHSGISHPFHGEVSTARWAVKRVTPTSVAMETGTRGPLSVRRSLVLSRDEAVLTVVTTLVNDTPLPASALLVEHIAFRSTDATRVGLPHGTWHHDEASPELRRAGDTDLSQPCPRGEFRLGYLGDVQETQVTIEDSELGFGAHLSWDGKAFPHLWYWQERGSEGFPWFGRADITALEPASAWPADGLVAAGQRGQSIHIGPFQHLEATVRVRVFVAESGERGSQ